MICKTLVCLTLLGVTAGMAASSGFLLGLDYSEWADRQTQQIATDGSGKLYILSACTNSASASSCVTKVSGDGKTILWQNVLGFVATAMAVDPIGGVYVTPSGMYGQPFHPFVEKLSTDGAGVAWKTPISLNASSGGGVIYLLALLAVDSRGRAFAAGYDAALGSGYVVRFSTDGAADYRADVNGSPVAIAVDPSGSEVVVGIYSPNGPASLAWLIPDSATKSYSAIPQVTDVNSLALAVVPDGDAVVSGGDYSGHTLLQEIAPTGTVRFSEPVPVSGKLAVDAAGNAYITGYSGSVMRPVKNSLAPCGTAWLSVVAPDGSILQTTYIPGASRIFPGTPLVATGAGSTFVFIAPADPTMPPTQAGAFVTNYLADPNNPAKLFRLSPNSSAQTYPLACLGNAASYGTGAIAPGEIVTLFGNGLGPQQGVSTEATPSSPFPTQAANAEVTFDGKPGPLIWVQDAQINVTVPWSVAGPSTQVCVSYNNVETNCLMWPVAQAAPGVVTVDGTHAAALNQDGSVNSAANPAEFGSIVSIFATGLGPISPPQADGALVGLPLPVNELPVQVDLQCTSLPCGVLGLPGPEVVYSGPAPFLIAGASQINFKATPQILFLAVGTPPEAVSSNRFQVYVVP